MDAYHPITPDAPPKKKKAKCPNWRKRMYLWGLDPHCHYCGEELPFDKCTLDHKLSRGRGGKNEIRNLVVCCKRCNKLKGEMKYAKFLRYIKKYLNDPTSSR